MPDVFKHSLAYHRGLSNAPTAVIYMCTVCCCGRAAAQLSSTKRGYNLFKTLVGGAVENGFPTDHLVLFLFACCSAKLHEARVQLIQTPSWRGDGERVSDGQQPRLRDARGLADDGDKA